jgi:hypothetical protein
MPKAAKTLMISDELVINKIYLIREQKMMLDFDLALLYSTETNAPEGSGKKKYRKVSR